MHHAGTNKPMMRRQIDVIEGVGTITQITSIQFPGQFTDHLQISCGDFLRNGGIVSPQVLVVKFLR